jgi:hypothetical protein
MKELDSIKRFFDEQFEKFAAIEFGFKYEYNAITSTHIIEVLNETLFSTDEFNTDAFSFAMDFMTLYNEMVLFIKPNDPIAITRVDYSVNNFDKKYNYITGSENIEYIITSILSKNTKIITDFIKSESVIKASTFASSNSSIYYAPAA